jgi:hypothetical protein
VRREHLRIGEHFQRVLHPTHEGDAPSTKPARATPARVTGANSLGQNRRKRKALSTYDFDD